MSDDPHPPELKNRVTNVRVTTLHEPHGGGYVVCPTCGDHRFLAAHRVDRSLAYTVECFCGRLFLATPETLKPAGAASPPPQQERK